MKKRDTKQMNYKTMLLSLYTIILLSGCNDKESVQENRSKESTPVVHKTTAEVIPTTKGIVKKDYTIEEIYSSMCITCHSSDGSGNTEKLTPSMADSTQEEMFIALKEIENDKGHIIMDHNRGEIFKMGMEYKAEDMAHYMFQRFHK